MVKVVKHSNVATVLTVYGIETIVESYFEDLNI